MQKSDKMLFGGMAILLGVTVAGFGVLATQKQNVQPVPYVVAVTATPLPTASASATPTLTPRTNVLPTKAVK